MLHRFVLLLLLTVGVAQSVTVRLVGGTDLRAGRLEVHYNGVWGTVCNDYFSNAAAQVVCHMLGYGHTGRYIGYFYGNGSGPVWLDNVQCRGTETSIDDCPHTGWGRNECGHNEDVSVSCVPDSTEAVALVGGGNPRAGRLEVFHGTQWGTVCNDGFTDEAARVICYSLGFGYVGRKVDVDLYGVGDGLIWLNNVVCHGTELYIGECSLDGWRDDHNCSHHQDVAVSCFDDSTATNESDSITSAVTPVRLVGGSNSTGRLEVLHDGVWGTVCDDSFTNKAVRVVCKMLGFESGSEIDNRNFRIDNGSIWLDNVQCRGTETDIAACSHNVWGVHNCRHNEDVAIFCYFSKIDVRLNGGRDPREGRLEVKYNGTWRSVCRDGFNDAVARDVCSMLGFGHVGRPSRNHYGPGPGSFWLQSIQCNGTEQSIAECAHSGLGLGSCSSDKELAAVSCLIDDAVGLFGSRHPRKGRLEIYHNGHWGTVCRDYFNTAAAKVVCDSLGFGYAGWWKSAINYGLGTSMIWLDNVQCDGTERNISKCSHREWGEHNCGHSRDVAVVCYGNRSYTSTGGGYDGRIFDIYFGTFYPVGLLIIMGTILLCLIKPWKKCRCRRAAESRADNPPDVVPDIIPLEVVAPATPPSHRQVQPPFRYESLPHDQDSQRY